MIDQSWLPLVTIALFSAALLAPVLPALVRRWLVVTRLVPQGPAPSCFLSTVVPTTLPAAPGTPGTALARAPSH